MSNYAYGHNRYDITVYEMYDKPDSFIENMEVMLSDSTDIRTYLSAQADRFSSDSLRSGQILMDLYSRLK